MTTKETTFSKIKSNLCPICKSKLERHRRKFHEKALSIFYSVKRYKCERFGHGCTYSTLKHD